MSRIFKIAITSAIFAVTLCANIFTLTDLGPIVGSPGVGVRLDINDAGQVVGTRLVGSERQAFLYSGGSFTNLGTLGGSQSGATGINNLGQVVGWSSTGLGASAFLYSGGAMHDLGIHGNNVVPMAINDSGQVAGNIWDSGCGEVCGFLYSGGSITDLGPLGGNALA